MPGGLLNLVSVGQENVLLTGNPKKTFFTCSYKKHTNFGLQRFRIDYEGQKTLSFDKESVFDFKIPRYAELLNDTYIVLTLPDIWSPIFNCDANNVTDTKNNFIPYQFQWNKNLGATMINRITIHSGGNILSQYSGEWLYNCIERDDTGKKELWNRMIGNEPRLYDPASVNGGIYPNAIYDGNYLNGCEPSIKGKKLYIPLMAWFCNNSKLSLPLIALQYQEVFIRIEFKAIKNYFTIMDIPPSVNLNSIEDVFQNYNTNDIKGVWPNSVNNKDIRKSPSITEDNHALWIFLQQPPQNPLNVEGTGALDDRYVKKNEWFVDLHLIGTYIFLSNDERECFAASNHNYLVKEVYEHEFDNITGSTRVDILARNMVSNLLFRFRRSDVYLRNEWFNYSNWNWEDKVPYEMSRKNEIALSNVAPKQKSEINGYLRDFKIENNKNILLDMGILCGEEYRENTLHYGIYDYVEKWNRTSGTAKDGLYMYNFSFDSNRYIYQPSGAQNVNKWKFITFEFNTLEPPKNPKDTSDIEVQCDPETGTIIGVRKEVYKLNKYNYDLKVFEERYNVIKISSGTIGLLNAR